MTDVALSGRTPQGGPRYVIIEASITVQRSDVLTARRRAELLHRVSGVITIPAVAGVLITEEARAAAPEGACCSSSTTPERSSAPQTWEQTALRSEPVVKTGRHRRAGQA